MGLPGLLVGDTLGAVDGAKDGCGVGLPGRYVGAVDGEVLGPGDVLQLGRGVGDPGT